MRGLVYIAFGEKARAEASRSYSSARKAGNELPAMIVGDGPAAGLELLPWEGPNPYDPTRPPGFRFSAGLVKPRLPDLIPWEECLYLDCDTEVLGELAPAFDLLARFDLLFTMHPGQNVNQLYNKDRAGWYHNRQERDATIGELGSGDIPYWNSGVIFWRKGEPASRVFAAWAEEWPRFGQWDEQLALMRAAFRCPARLAVLPAGWNHPHRARARAIFHNYGRGVVRVNTHENLGQLRHGIPSWLTDDETRLLRELAAAVPAGGRILEVGSLYGASTATMALANPEALVTTIDAFWWSPLEDCPASSAQLRRNLEEAGCLESVTIREGDSREIGRSWSEPIDFLFIDGGHDFESCRADLFNFGPHAQVIALHDCDNPFWPDIRGAADAFGRWQAGEGQGWEYAEQADTLAVLRRV